MSSGSPSTTYIPEPASPTITTSRTPKRDYKYAADYLNKLEAERKELEQKTWNELSDVYRQETAKEDQYYRDSLAKDEPDYTAGLDPYQLNTIASQVYGGGAAAALEDLRNRRSREYVAVAGANPMAPPPTPAAPIPITIPGNLFTPAFAPAGSSPAPSGPVGRMTETPKYQSQLLAVPGMTTKTKPSGKTVFTLRSPSGGVSTPAQHKEVNKLKGQWHIDKMREQGKSQEYIDNFKRQSAWMFK